MTLHLVHGPASSEKRDHLLNEIQALINSNKPFSVIVPHEGQAKALRREILNKLKIRCLLGNMVLTWPEFLESLCKKNFKNHHRTSVMQRHYILGLLALGPYKNFFSPQIERLYETVKELDGLFQKIKKLDSTLTDWQKKLGNKTLPDHLVKLFEDYEKELESTQTLDQADLSRLSLQALKNKTYNLNKDTHLIFTDFYPLPLEDRELIRQLKNQTSTAITLYYDETWDQTDKHLEESYEDLGLLADTNEAFTAPNLNFHVQSFKTNEQEIEWVCEQIKKAIRNGINPGSFAIVTSDLETSEKYAKRLKIFKLAFANFFEAPLSNLGINHLESDLVQETLQGSLKFYDSYFLRNKLKALSLLHDLNFEIGFLNNQHEALLSQIPKDRQKSLIDFLINDQKPETSVFDEQVIVVPLKMAESLTERQIFLTGFNVENILTKTESLLFPRVLQKSPAFAELFEPARFHTKAALEKTKHLLCKAPRLLLTRSETDTQGRPTTPLHFSPHKFSYSNHIVALQHYNETKAAIEFTKAKRQTFTVSALQDYLDCPYLYYARHVLSLGNKDEDLFEPGADKKGSFVHQVLHRLIAENQSDYLEGLEYESYRKRVLEKTVLIIEEEAQKSKDFAEFSPEIIRIYKDRVLKTIVELIKMEASFFKEKKKKTTPSKFEISFSPKNKEGLILATDHGSISILGRIDRIDVCRSDKNFTVIDYKTGTPPSLTDIKNGTALQLPLYIMAVQKNILPDYKPSAALYYTLKTNEVKGLALRDSSDNELFHKRSQITADGWQDISVTVHQKINEIVKGIFQSEFNPKPRDESKCSFCAYNRICGYEKGTA